ncbi:peptide ABC transporter substrate-binding protein [Cellulosilyticum sp. I15G10I2]|uniref:peptide ABC transporter substrate-binding protein n=1 Tax=Cellulosilyticum sp. I15G10I2 TaxID=1892843 RepID=UPI00085BDDEE|nr:peptide ABC transporter substrate-binding protein [Cellulosilyticum sp. I15G10I2]
MMKSYKMLGISLIALMLCVGCNSFDMVVKDEPVNNMPTQEVPLDAQTNKPSENKMTIAMNVPETLNPLYNTQDNVQQTLLLLFSPLINIEENGSVSANVAHSWMLNENNTAITITLNNNINWHDGMPLTTEDVIFSMEQIQKIQDSPYKQAVDNVASLEKIDDTTFKILYRQPFSGVLQTLFFPIIPKHIYDVADNRSLNIIPIGSGPYIFKSMTPLKNIRLEANNHYFKGTPHIEEIEVSIIPDEESSLHSFKQNLIDVVYTNITEWGKYASDKSSKAYEFTSNIYEFMGVNFNKVMFQNSNVRKALLYALDRQKMAYLYYLDHVIVTDTPISPSSYLVDKSLKVQESDKEKAKLLLTQEGYERDDKTGLMTKNDIPFSFNLLVNAENKDRVKIADEIKKMYKEVGIDVNIEIVDKDIYLSRIETKQYDAFLGGWQLSYALDLSFALHSSKMLSGENYANYKDEKMDDLLQQAFLSTESTAVNTYSKLQQYFAQENPYISLFFKKKVLITKEKIAGEIKPTPLNIFANVEEWMIE